LKLVPDYYCRSLENINFQTLKSHGIKCLLFDVDNTVTRWNEREVSEATVKWFDQLKEAGFKACLLSNNRSDTRVKVVAEKLGISYIYRAAKPSKGGYLRAVKLLNGKPGTIAMVGDQLFTDVWGAKRAGLFTILIDPICLKHEFFGTKFNRALEKLVISKAKGRSHTF